MKHKDIFIAIAVIIVLLIIGIIVALNNQPKTPVCRDVQVPYEEQEAYTEQESYQEPIIISQQQSQSVYDSTLQASTAGGKVFAFFNIKQSSIIKGTITTSKRSYFGITNPEECDNILNGKPFKPGYVVQNDITFYSIDKDTFAWEGNPTSLCIHVWDSDWQNSNLNIVQIQLTNYWTEDEDSYETKYRPVTKYRTITKYKTEQQCS